MSEQGKEPPQTTQQQSEQGVHKGTAPSSPQQSQQSPSLVPVQGPGSPASASESSDSSEPSPIAQYQAAQPGQVHSQHHQNYYSQPYQTQGYLPPQFPTSSSSPSTSRYPQIDPRLQAGSYIYYQQQLVAGVGQPRLPPPHHHDQIPPRNLPLIAQHQEQADSPSGGEGKGAGQGQGQFEQEREYGENGSASSYSPQPSSRRTSESSGYQSGPNQQQIPFVAAAYSQWPPGYPPLQGYYQPPPSTGWHQTSPRTQGLPDGPPPMITRPLGGGRPSPAQGHRPNPWSDPSSASPQVNTQQLPTYAPYPAPQPASSASTSQNNLPPIIRRAPFPTIPAHELQASQKVSQIPIFGVNTIGGAIPQGGGGGANSQGGENDQDESNDNGNANKGKRMQKPSNAYTIPTITGVNPFVTKLRYMLNHPAEFDDLICWSEDGECVLVDFGDENLAEDLLPRVFNHSNPGAFNRQFINYGFKLLKGADLSLALMQTPPSPPPPVASSSNATPAPPPTVPTPRSPDSWRAYVHTHTPEELAQALADEKVVALKLRQQQKEARKKQKKKEWKVQGKEWTTDDEESEESEEGDEGEEEEDGNWFSVETMTNFRILARLKPKTKSTGGAGEKRKGSSDAGGNGGGGKKAKVAAGGGNSNRMIGGVEVQGLLR